MNSSHLAVPLLFALTTAACRATSPASSSSEAALGTHAAAAFTWPTPAGWKLDTRPFPLSYAPNLPYQSGVEVVQFMPRFFDASAETYWSYNFAWVVDGASAPSAVSLGAELEMFYAGLAKSVAPDRFDPKAHHATVTLEDRGKFHGEASTVDAFGDGRTLRLGIVGETFVCKGQHVILASASPRAANDAAVWNALAAQRATFQCT
jgi:hypothetical protein